MKLHKKVVESLVVQRGDPAGLQRRTCLVKIFLHHSEEEQKNRLLVRPDDPNKFWRFAAADLAERAYFDDYTRDHEAAITATSTSWAPWHVIPADHRYECRAIVGGNVSHMINHLDLQPPTFTKAGLATLNKVRRALLAV
ncbi:polyphosphate kinase 2 family protein [Lacisediminihabitans sp. FW035]